ncbi:MAG TPA: PAS domain S-box protein [Burkholderiales bacterium]|nr:PAS domain S-box protein [Burkholderiales bacterium]
MSPDRQPQHRYPDDELFGSLFDQEATGIAVTTLAGRFLRVNRALCRMIGYSAEELLQKSFQDITHPEDVESNEDFRQRLLSGEAAGQTHDKRYVRKDGKLISVRIVVTVVRDASGSPQCCTTLVHDMTANMQAHEASRESEHRFRRMVELSTDWYWEQDAQFRFVRVPGFEKGNFDPQAVIGKARWELPDLGPLPEKVWERHRAALERREPFHDFVFLRRNKSGEMRYLSVSGEPVFDPDGKFTGYRGIGKDVTEQVRAQKALEDSEARYHMLFDVHPHPMWVVDSRTLAFLAVNDAAVRHYGYSRGEFLSMTADQIRPPEEVDQLLKAFQDQSRSYRHREWLHRKKSGELIHVEIVSFNLEFDGKPARLGVVTDITERLKAEERAREIDERYQSLLKGAKNA